MIDCTHSQQDRIKIDRGSYFEILIYCSDCHEYLGSETEEKPNDYKESW